MRPGVAEAALTAAILVLCSAGLLLNPDGGDPQSSSASAQVLWGAVYAYAIVGLWRCRYAAAMLVRRSLPLVFLVAELGLTAMWSADPAVTLKRAIGLLGTTAVAYYLVCRFEHRRALAIVAVAMGATVAMSLVAVAIFPSFGVMQDEYAGSWRGVFAHKNTAGAALALAIPALLVFLRSGASLVRVAAILAAVASAIFLVGTQSASAIVATAVAASILVVVWLSRSARLRPFAIVLGIGLALSMLMGVLHWQDAIDALGRDATLTGRTDIWPAALQAIADKPLLGYGYSVFWLPDGPVLQYIGADKGWHPYHAHEGFLQLALDGGLVAVATFGLVALDGLAAALSYARRTPLDIAPWPLVAIGTFLLLNLSDSLIAGFNSVIWVMFSVAYLSAVSARPLRETQTARYPSRVASVPQ
ncbi:MAG: O-antigen ligase family protein [Candidatus Eremiobacteraeota bacterium]|nr:O-antigen ligase family protein [Candidatus Eremiobacteraeota bacterium]